MKRFAFMLFMSVLCAVVAFAQGNAEPQATSWNLVSVPDADVELINADATNWKKDSNNRYCYMPAMTVEPAKAGGTELSITKGLKFTVLANSDGNLRLGGSTKSLWLGDQCSMIIPEAKAGQWIQVEFMTSKNTATRNITATNLAAALPATTGKTHTIGQAKILADGDVTLKIEGGMYFYSLVVGDSLAIFGEGGSGGSETSPDNPDNPKDETHAFDINCDMSQLHTTIFGTGPKLYVSPDGKDDNDGLSPEKPFKSVQHAINMAVEPGTTIVLAPGEYRPTARINIDNRNGTHDNYNALVCLDGRAVINCDHPQHGHSDNPYQGVRLTSSYWYFYHVDITNASDNGLLIERNKPTGGSSADIVKLTDQAHDNIIEACNFYKNGDTGLQMKNLASYNYVINCDAYLNCDEDQGDADGFAPKISVGTGNYFFGCRAYLNSDDGWDVFYKKDGNFGDNQTIIMDRCITYKNGFLDENSIAPKGNGNGFKCGSDQGAMNVYLNRCLAVHNKAKGFDQNHNSGDIILNNCTGMTTKDNGDKAYSYRIYESINTAEGHKVEVTNCIAINDNDEKDKRDSAGNLKVSEAGKNGDYGRFQLDETLDGLTVKTSEFGKARPEFFESIDDTQLIAARDANDNLPEIQFAHIKPNVSATYSYTANKKPVSVTVSSDALIDAGTDVTTTSYRDLAVPAISFNGAAPDLGAYETAGDVSAITAPVVAGTTSGKASFITTLAGACLVTVKDASLADVHTVTISTLAGQLLTSHTFRGSSAVINMQQHSSTGPVIITVKGSVANESIKSIVR